MKKLLSAFFLSVLFLSGCTVNTAPQEIEIDRSFAARAVITQNSAAYTADFEINENGCSAAFVSPEEVNGLKISFDGTAFTYSLGELSFTAAPKNEVQQFLPMIYAAVSDRAAAAVQEEEHYTLQGSTPYGTYYMNVNKDTLLPAFIEFEEADLSVRFE